MSHKPIPLYFLVEEMILGIDSSRNLKGLCALSDTCMLFTVFMLNAKVVFAFKLVFSFVHLGTMTLSFIQYVCMCVTVVTDYMKILIRKYKHITELCFITTSLEVCTLCAHLEFIVNVTCALMLSHGISRF